MSDIRKIGDTIDHYKSVDNGRLSKHLIHQLNTTDSQDIEDAKEFVLTYIGVAEPALAALQTATKGTSNYSLVEPIIEECIAYFRKTNDLIDAHQHGLYGLLDDTYRTLQYICAVNDTMVGINLPFDIEQLKTLNKTVQALLPEQIVQQIDSEVSSKKASLLIAQINQTYAEKTSPQPLKVNFYNGLSICSFSAYPILSDLTTLAGKKGIYAYTRLETKNGKNTHYVLFIGTRSNLAEIPQQRQIDIIKRENPSHICVYPYNKDDITVQNLAKMFITYYKPIFNKETITTPPPNTNTGQRRTTTQIQMKSCYTCYGSGSKVCSSCGGSGGRYQSRVDYDWEGRPNYRDEWINCYACSGGYATCPTCGGKGEVMA